MKKAGAILLLCTMLLSQYGRLVAYVRCAISGLVDPNAPCDCEQQAPQALKGDDAREMTPPRGMDIVFEEYYLPASPWQIDGRPATSPRRFAHGCRPYTSAFIADIFRPPAA
ncbi:MAG TPA: hypothetical protein VL547_12230 [Dinghuibacter sp.]|uniref:hypothetical protein n=1 Tax=Dinghuibacter sp. TaxID=2024697 RepID=UPI002C5EE92F|nr:hypothetical protein [Dinghuibacter sp.]HTJ12792.1 hypothetical protein [Dinghuibacter sp.]